MKSNDVVLQHLLAYDLEGIWLSLGFSWKKSSTHVKNCIWVNKIQKKTVAKYEVIDSKYLGLWTESKTRFFRKNPRRLDWNYERRIAICTQLGKCIRRTPFSSLITNLWRRNSSPSKIHYIYQWIFSYKKNLRFRHSMEENLELVESISLVNCLYFNPSWIYTTCDDLWFTYYSGVIGDLFFQTCEFWVTKLNCDVNDIEDFACFWDQYNRQLVI